MIDEERLGVDFKYNTLAFQKVISFVKFNIITYKTR